MHLPCDVAIARFDCIQIPDPLSTALRDLVSASVETTASTLEHFVLYGIMYPSVMCRLQAEVDAVVGFNRKPSLVDRPSMPYTEACILEILRLSSNVPLAFPHCAMSDVRFRGCKISKGTIVIGNLYAVHHDPELWLNPEEFQPERFLTPAGKLIEDGLKQILPFSTGRRVCLGFSIVAESMFLILTSLYQKFDFVSQEPVTSVDSKFSIVTAPLNVRVTAVAR